MSENKRTRAIWIAASGAVLAWPIGALIGMVLSFGQDGPGSAMAQAFGGLITAAVWIVSTGLVVWNLRKGGEDLGKKLRVAALLAIVFLPIAASVAAVNHQNYTLRVMNETELTFDNVYVQMSGRRFSFGIMSGGKYAARSFEEVRPKGVAQVHWTDVSGAAQMAEVDLTDVVPRRYDNGVLTFVFVDENSVRAGFYIRDKFGY